MAGIKLGKLPDRTPVKLTISITPDLKAYAALYRKTYGEEAAIADLVPAMLSKFIETDRNFAKMRARPTEEQVG